jgi:hypothetical protein
MNGLLAEVLAGHGGIDRWERYGAVCATIVSGGDLFDAKGINADATPRKVSMATKSERMVAMPFGNPDWTVFVATTIRSTLRGVFRQLNTFTTCKSLPDFGFQRNAVLIPVTQT